MKIRILIEREVTPQEAAVMCGIVLALKPGDVFSLENTDVRAKEHPTLPPPRIVDEPQRRTRLSWPERVQAAFEDFSSYMDGKFQEHVAELRAQLDWGVQEIADWRPYTTEELAEMLVLEKNAAEIVVRRLLHMLGRPPAPKPCPGYQLPPTIDQSAEKEAKKAEETAAANIAQTGDPHIGFGVQKDLDPKSTIEVAFSKLNPDYTTELVFMTMPEFLAWAGIHDTHVRGYANICGYAAKRYYGCRLERVWHGTITDGPIRNNQYGFTKPKDKSEWTKAPWNN